ncbi:MAG: transglutaminase domain-containing protein [Lachnospiraceae bacterium]|nr:transglutaminase domain-containing protein [Lachnospiraceae bacterium]
MQSSLKIRKLNKKRAISFAVAMVMVLSIFTGCENLSFFKADTEQTQKIDLDNNISRDIIIVEKVEELDDSNDETAELPAKDLAKASQELVKNDGLKYYAYDELNDDEKIIYTEIYSIISTLSKDTKVSTKDPDEIEKAFNYVMLDHPEIFYVTGYSFTKYMRGNKIEKITLSGNYTMNASEVEANEKLVDEYVDKCMSSYDGPVDDYEKVKYVYEYLIKNTEYDMAAKNNQNILSVVTEGRTVCQGYAKSMQLILNRMGVFCILCEGIVKGTEAHVWNIVRIDDNYYQVDATWGDASYMIEDNTGDFEAPEINYDYLCVTDDEIKETHVFKDNITRPICDSMRDNYYVREGLYLTEINTDVIMAAFDRAREMDEKVVTLKCSNANVYSALYNHLVENHGIFDYLKGSTTVNYVQFRDACRISFYI